MWVFIFSTNLSKTFLIIRRIQQVIIINKRWSSCKLRVILDRFNCNLNFLTDFRKTQILNLMKIRPLGAESFHADGRTNGQT
jgi:hypothetical protein